MNAMTLGPSFDARSFLARLWAQDAVLVRAGFPPISPWWRAEIERFFLRRMSRRALRRWVIRCGRRSGKSSTMCRIAVAWALYGPWTISPGDLAVFPFVSVALADANARIRTIDALLSALSVAFRRTAEGIQLTGDRPVLFRSFASNTQAVIGFTSIAILCDEVCAWTNEDESANPAAEVLSYLMPTTATMPHAFVALISSPRSVDDLHYQWFTKGETAEQQVAEAPTWVANDSITEAETHALEPDLRVWSREYAAIPQASVLGAFDADAIERAFAPRSNLDTAQRHGRVLVIDASSGRKDTWAGCIAGWSVGDRPYLVVDQIDGIEGRFWQQISGDAVVERFATLAKNAGVYEVHADQREALMLSAAFQRHGIKFFEHSWTATNKPQAVASLRRWLAEGTLALPQHGKLRAELLKFEERSTPSGGFTFGARGSGHDDYVALLITLALADAEGQLSGSPNRSNAWPAGPLYVGISRDEMKRKFWGDPAPQQWHWHADDWDD
jgi:hypothetical protein